MIRATTVCLFAAAAVTPTVAAFGSAETLSDLASLQIVSNVPFENQSRTIAVVGIRRARLGLRWYEVEKARGHYDWSLADRKIGALLRSGITPIITLFGGNSSYPSGSADHGGPPVNGEALVGYARFAAAAATRYKTIRADRPIFYEIWNEPNTKTFWGRAPDPEAYAHMAETACLAIKKAAPQAKVLALAMEGTPVKAPYYVRAYGIDIYQQWAARAATPGLMKCADGFSMHPYLPSPEQTLGAEPRLQAFVAAHWPKSTPPLIVNSEWGYAVDSSRGRTATDQAALDLRALLIGAGLKRVTNLYQAVDGGRDPSKPDQSFGLVTYFGQFKPAGDAVRRLLRAIGNFEIEGIDIAVGTQTSPGVYRFAASNGRERAQVLWTSAAPRTTKVSPTAQAVDLISGAEKLVIVGEVEVGPAPTLVTWTE